MGWLFFDAVFAEEFGKRGLTRHGITFERGVEGLPSF
jgi:hypothetical protein